MDTNKVIEEDLIEEDLDYDSDAYYDYMEINDSINYLNDLVDEIENAKLGLGDYISFLPDDKAKKPILTQIIKINGLIHLLNLETLENVLEPFNSLDEINDLIEKGDLKATCYRGDKANQEKPGEVYEENLLYKYMLYDIVYNNIFEVAIFYEDEEEVYRIYQLSNGTITEDFHSEHYETFEDAYVSLCKGYTLVKKLRV